MHPPEYLLYNLFKLYNKYSGGCIATFETCDNAIRLTYGVYGASCLQDIIDMHAQWVGQRGVRLGRPTPPYMIPPTLQDLPFDPTFFQHFPQQDVNFIPGVGTPEGHW